MILRFQNENDTNATRITKGKRWKKHGEKIRDRVIKIASDFLLVVVSVVVFVVVFVYIFVVFFVAPFVVVYVVVMVVFVVTCLS